MDLDLIQTPAGVELPVKAAPGSRKNEIRGIQNRLLKIAVTAVAEKGKAYHAIRDLLAKELNISKTQITLISGPTISRKKFLVSGTEISTIRQHLRRSLNER